MKITSLIIPTGFAIALGASAAPSRKVRYEPPVHADSVSRQQNLLVGGKASASGHWDKQSPDLAINGNRSVGDHWACENIPVWHQVDMGEIKAISALRVWPYWGDGRVYQYKVEGSPDGKSWKILADHSANSITATADGDQFQFDSTDIRYLRTTFLKNSRGDSNGGHLVEIEAYASAPSLGLMGGIGSIDLRYPPSGALDLKPAQDGIELSAWRGERVNAQIAVSSETDQTNLRIDAAELVLGEARIPILANFIRYTLADGKPQGDILDDAKSLPLAAGTNRPVWLSVNVPKNSQPGLYKGVLTVRSDQGKMDFPISLDVIAASIPSPDKWVCHLDLWQHPQSVARWHDVPAWSSQHLALLKPQMQRLAEAGQKTITCTLIEEAWGGQTYDTFPSMVQWTLKADGSWKYDFSIFDKWVTFMSDEVGMKDARIHCYSMIPWSLKFRYYDEKSASHMDANLRPGTDAYDAFWGSFLKSFTAHLKEKGWLERTLIGMDERPDVLMRGAMATLKKHAPELKIASAINHPSELNREMQDISPIISELDSLTLDELDLRRSQGRITTYYVCTAPPVPNTFTFSPPAESEWLGIFAAARGFDGFLRWAYHSWVENPLQSTDFTSWPSGDCFLIYPGNRSSVRFERLRDGLENFEKIHLLRTWAKENNPDAKQAAALEAMEESLRPFTWERGSKSGVHADDVRAANMAIDAAARSLMKS